MNYRYVPALLYMALIFYISSIPLPKPIEQVTTFYFDPGKHLAHLVEYAILSALLYVASRNVNKSFIVSAFYGLSDEVHQYFVPTRLFDPVDLTFDVLGALLGALFTALLCKKVAERKEASKLSARPQQRVFLRE